MNILTLNCHAWLEDRQQEKIDAIVERIASEEYDLIALQEVNQHKEAPLIYGNIRENNFAHVLVERLKELDLHYHMTWDFAHYGYDIYEEGVAILSRTPFLSTESFFVSKTTDPDNYKSRKIVKAVIEGPETPMTVYSCHFGWWHDEEEPVKHQLDELLRRVEHDDHALLLGDFNNDAFIRGEGYDYLMENGLQDLFHLATEREGDATVQGKIAGWDENKKSLRIDLMLTNAPIHVSRHAVVFDGENGPIVSDHAGVEATVFWR